MSVAFDVNRVDSAISQGESGTEWRLSFPARLAIHLFCFSLASDTGYFKLEMTDEVRTNALNQAYEGIGDFVREVIKRTQELSEGGDYSGKEVSLPVIMESLNTWPSLKDCSCWPR